MKYELNRLYNIDCMEAMQEIPDKYFELAIVDPIYGDVRAGGYMTGKSQGGVARHPKYNYAIWNQKKDGCRLFYGVTAGFKKSDYMGRQLLCINASGQFMLDSVGQMQR